VNRRLVSEVINDVHLNNNSTFGQSEIGQNASLPLTPSVNYSSAYAFRSISNLEGYHRQKDNADRYGRDSNLLTRQAEQYFSSFSEGLNAYLFSSGMGAISACIDILSEEADIFVTFGSFYRKTDAIIQKYCIRKAAFYINASSIDELKLNDKVTPDSPVLFFIENFSNPFLRVVDIAELRKLYPNSRIILDFTLQGLMNNNSEIGAADLSVSSCTKYISGHNDLIGGIALTGNNSLANKIWDYRSMHGGILGPHEAYMLLRSLRTYDMRMDYIDKNINIVIDYLDSHPSIKRIFYPFMFENTDQGNLRSNYAWLGGLISFEVLDSINLEKNIEKLCSIKMAPSFGSVDSLVEIPKYMSNRIDNKSDHLINSNRFVRLSIGCEPIRYIINDLNTLLSC
jgi:cystathionine gamma-synthase